MKHVIAQPKDVIGDWVAARVKRTAPWGSFGAIGLVEEGKLIAGMVATDYVPNARCSAHIASEGKGWLTRAFIQACCTYWFDQLKCKVVIGMVDADNEAALRFDRHFGFKDLCVLKDGAGDCDLVVLELRREDCRWLNMKRGAK